MGLGGHCREDDLLQRRIVMSAAIGGESEIAQNSLQVDLLFSPVHFIRSRSKRWRGEGRYGPCRGGSGSNRRQDKGGQAVHIGSMRSRSRRFWFER
ncbi:hypothetical protein Dsin_004782 [Dipteronia sinensis]|uniref:Uncharacterized protein n=1 Tax=Dipteronia sinensis TaxID=43782 RepID=A0AAE0EFV0_9ROSI|nr:hypothetical protein Dsin_004782 [Dipteronia sinensis]